MTASVVELVPALLTAAAFAPFGEVIDLASARTLSINQGLTTRFHDLATVEAAGDGARVLVNVFRSTPLPLPHRVTVMERHPLGSQAFLPMGEARFLVLVAEGEVRPDPASFALFLSDGRQGINLARNTWHHFHMVLDAPADFVVIDRGGPGDNLEEVDVSGLALLVPAVR